MANSESLLETLRNNRLKSYQATPGDIEEHRRAELRVAGDTAGRPLVELIQNADDAMNQAPESEKNHIKLILQNSSLFIANVGAPFTPEGVEAICNLDRSPKIDRRITIGNKGIGFKSVLTWTEKPSIHSTTYEFTYDREKSAREISHALSSKYQAKNVPLMRLPFSPTSRDELTNQLLEEGYSTVVILPIKNETVSKLILDELKSFDTLTLLFLNAVSHLLIITENFTREHHVFRKQNEIVVTVDGKSKTYKFFKNEKKIPDRIVSSLPEDCRDLTHSAISVAIPEKPIENYYKLFSHFPTTERCPFKFFTHGDFILDAGRKHLRVDAEAHNQWIFEEIALLFANKIIPSFGRNNPTVIDFLESRSKKDMEPVESQIFDAFVEKIGRTDFLQAFKNPANLVSPKSGCVSKEDTINDIINIFEKEVEWESRFLIDEVWSKGSRLETLKKLGCKEIEKPNFVVLMGALARPEPDWCTEILNIILKWIDAGQYWISKEIINSLKNQKLFLTINLELRSLSSGSSPPLFLPPSEKKYIEIPSFIPLDFLNPDLGNNIEKTELKLTFKNRLQNLSEHGLHPFKPREIVEKAVLPIIENFENSDKYGPNYQKDLILFLAQLEPSESKFENIDPYPCFNELRTKLSEKVCVPTEDDVWKPAWKVYATKEWGAYEQLRQVYEGATDRYFLASPGQEIHRGIPVEKWKNLYRYLGVSWEPKILGIETRPSSISQYSFSNLHPSMISEQDWEQYKMYFRDAKSLSDMWRWSIQLKESYVLDNWDNVRKNPEKSINLLHLLYLTDIYSYVVDKQKDKIRCRFRYTKISNSYAASCDSFLSWGINSLDWLSSKGRGLLPPQNLFLKDSEVGKDLKGIVPILQIGKPQDKVLNRRFEDLIEEIGLRTRWDEITAEDWNNWLLEFSKIEADISKDHVRLAQNLYRHCLEQCNISEDKEPFSDINVLSQSAGGRYEFKLAKDVIYLNEPRFDSIKRILLDSEYSFFSVELGSEKRAKKAKELFGLSLASEIIDEDVIPGEKLLEKSEEWQSSFNKISPVLLARLRKDRTEGRTNDQEFFKSVTIVVVASLTKTFRLLENKATLHEDKPDTCWSNSDYTLYLNANSQERDLWSGIAESLSQRLGQTYYEAFENLILCRSDTERIEKLRKAGVPEDEVTYCENALKEEPSDVSIDLNDIKGEDTENQKQENDESAEETIAETEEKQTESDFLDPETDDLGEEIEAEEKNKNEETKPESETEKLDEEGEKPLKERKPQKDKEVDQGIKEKTELAAMGWAERYEIERGREPTDVSHYNRGYDIESVNPLTGKKRFIEVKGALGCPDKREVTINEWRKAIELGDDYYIYYSLGIGGDEGEIRIIRNPAKKITPDEKAFDVNLSRESMDKYISLKKKRK